MSVIHAPRRPKLGLRQLVVLVLIILAMAVLFLRLWYLQVVRAGDLAGQADAFREDNVAVLAPRGLIVDRAGKLLAGVHSVLTVLGVPSSLHKKPDEVQHLAEILGIPVSKVNEKLQSASNAYLPTPILVGTTVEAATQIAEEGDALPDVAVESQPLRYYPDPRNYSHVLGYVWTPSAQDMKRLTAKKIKPATYVGKLNVEALYEPQLMGSPGKNLMELDVRGKPLRVLDRGNPSPGDKLVLSIDDRLQRIAMEELSRVIERETHSGGAAVALDPKTGEVLCLASSPSFDASAFGSGISTADFNALRNDPMQPMFNRAISGSYSPGSTFKIVTTLAAERSGVLDSNRQIFCPGYFKVGSRTLKCLGHHGWVSYKEALTKSCNAYFADLGVRAGDAALKQAALDVGLGQRTGIDLTGEYRALVPTDAWWKATHKDPWRLGDTVNMAIGQGEVSTTPIQMASLIATVANEGKCFKPHIVRAFEDRDGAITGVSPVLQRQVQAEPATWQLLKDSLINVIENGTGKQARINGITWAGKTGSTEHSRNGKKTHSWFVGFAPADDPKIAICVLVEQAGHGGEIAAPIAAKIVKAYLGEDIDERVAMASENLTPASAAHLASSGRRRRS